MGPCVVLQHCQTRVSNRSQQGWCAGAFFISSQSVDAGRLIGAENGAFARREPRLARAYEGVVQHHLQVRSSFLPAPWTPGCQRVAV